MRIRFTALATILRWRPARKIFVSYRRADTQEIAERLYEHLSQQFGAANVFLDVPDIEPGQRWGDELKTQLSAADVVIALIGPRWVEILEAKRSSDDVLLLELASALAQQKQIIPVLVGETSMPESVLLPPEVRGLADFQALTINPDDVDRGMRQLLGRLKPGLSLAVAWALVNLFGWLAGLLVLPFTLMAFGVLEDNYRIPDASAPTLLAFAIAGALLGICIGVPQWLVLRSWFGRAQFLVPAYVLVSAISVGFAATSVGAAILMILLLPVGLGATLWTIVRKQLVYAGWWSAFNAVAPFAGIMMAPANRSVTESVQQPANLATLSHFFLLMLLPTSVSGLLLVWLMRRSQMKRK